MKNRFDTIIFDWDGTLINSIDWIVDCLQSAAQGCHLPIPIDQAAKDVIGLSIENAMLTLYPDADAVLQQRLIDAYRHANTQYRIGPEHLFSGVFDMLVTLKQSGYALAVATGKTRTGLQHAMAATGTEELFDITRCADETASKPEPLMLLQILQHTNTASERALMVGDSTHDLQMAANANMAAVAVSCGAHSAELLRQYHPLHCLQQPAELLALIY